MKVYATIQDIGILLSRYILLKTSFSSVIISAFRYMQENAISQILALFLFYTLIEQHLIGVVLLVVLVQLIVKKRNNLQKMHFSHILKFRVVLNFFIGFRIQFCFQI